MSRPLNIGIITRFTGSFYHGALINAINQRLHKNNANLFIINTYMIYRFSQGQGKDLLYYKLALNHIDGWIILTEGASDQLMEMIYNTRKPIVTVSFIPKDIKCITILEDSRYSGETVTQHLIDHGHRKIAFIGCSYLYDMRERFEGYKKALENNSIPFDPTLSFMTPFSNVNMLPFSKSSVQQLIECKREFTAIFAGNDLMAIGIIDSLKEYGFRVPEDIAVIGYDNTIYAKSSDPSLSSVCQDLTEMGTAAAESIIKSIMGGSITDETVLIKSNIITRRSCGCMENPNDEEDILPSDSEFKNTMIDYLQKEIGKSYNVASEMLKMDIIEIKSLVPMIAGSCSMQCIGFWNENSGDEKKLIIQQIIDEKSKTVLNPDITCTIEDFPPEEFLQYLNESDNDNILWLLPISSTTRSWCIIAYIGPYNKTDLLFAYDSSVILLNLLGIFLDRIVSNAELQNTLETLQKTQEQLIHSEKMVSLGTLVAGVAHEINTPIGVSVTAASFMKERSLELIKLFESGKLKRSDLEKYFEINNETIDILLINLNKASDLVKSFKQIAVDQSHEEKRRFNVKEYISEVLLSLNPKLKKTRIIVNIDCSDDLEIYHYPGALSQIITNLVVNSLIHAYEEDDNGVISIKVSSDEHIITFIYSDDGKGIDKDILDKIFDPFFTTKRGAGGTGLGLNIVYNMVTQQYGGSINCKSTPGKGTSFIIKIPIKDGKTNTSVEYYIT